MTESKEKELVTQLKKDDDDTNIKADESELTEVQIIREQLSAMSEKRSDVRVIGGVNGDFFFGGIGTGDFRNNLLHGVMYRKGKCLKDSFDGGTPCTVFAIMDDGTARIMTQEQYARDKGSIYEALGGRQILLSDGQSPTFTDETYNPRTAVGVSKDGKKVIILVVDGRSESYSAGASYKLLADMLSAMGAYEAINLDGGGSSTFAVNNNGTFETLNRPTDTTGDRKVVNGLAVIEKL